MRDYPVPDFGAVGSGVFMNTQAIRAAIRRLYFTNVHARGLQLNNTAITANC